jgi:hypothetical protein
VAYRNHHEFCQSYELEDRYGSSEAYLAAQRTQAQRAPDFRVAHVQITAIGRLAVNSSAAPQLTESSLVTRNLEPGQSAVGDQVDRGER